MLDYRRFCKYKCNMERVARLLNDMIDSGIITNYKEWQAFKRRFDEI